jgi:hypothetical protein
MHIYVRIYIQLLYTQVYLYYGRSFTAVFRDPCKDKIVYMGENGFML